MATHHISDDIGRGLSRVAPSCLQMCGRVNRCIRTTARQITLAIDIFSRWCGGADVFFHGVREYPATSLRLLIAFRTVRSGVCSGKIFNGRPFSGRSRVAGRVCSRRDPRGGLSGADRSAAELTELRHRNLVSRRQSDFEGTGYPHEAGASGAAEHSHATVPQSKTASASSRLLRSSGCCEWSEAGRKRTLGIWKPVRLPCCTEWWSQNQGR
jgi:hypothetical protein